MKMGLKLSSLALGILGLLADNTSGWDFCTMCSGDKPPPGFDPGGGKPPPYLPPPCTGGASGGSVCPTENAGAGPTCSGDPVSLDGSTLNISRTDIIVPGIIPIKMDFLYQSKSNLIGHFGFGWYSNYELRINRDVDGNYFLRTESGEVRKYSPLGEQLAGLTSRDIFRVNSDGSYVLERWDGLIDEFSPLGILIKQRDRSGNFLRFIYQESGTGAPVKLPIYGVSRYMPYTDYFEIAGYDYQLLRIENGQSPNLQSLTFTYNSFGWVEQSTDPTGRNYQYVYDPNYGTLKRVINPAQEFLYYTYDPAHPFRLVSFVNQAHCNQDGAELVVNQYDSLGRIALQTFNGREHSFDTVQSSGILQYGTTHVGPLGLEFMATNGPILDPVMKRFTFTNVYHETVRNFSESGTVLNILKRLYTDTTVRYEPATFPGSTKRTQLDSQQVEKEDGSLGWEVTRRLDILNAKGMLILHRDFPEIGLGDSPNSTYLDDSIHTTTLNYDSRNRLVLKRRALYKGTKTGYVAGGVLSPGGDMMLLSKLVEWKKFQYFGVYPLPIRESWGQEGGDSSVILYEYDPHSLKLRFKKELVDPTNSASALVTEFRYDTRGLLVEKVDPRGHAIRFEYDDVGFGNTNSIGLGFLTAEMNAEGERQEWKNNNGNPIEAYSPRGGKKTYQYDGLARPTQTCDATGICDRFTYKNSKLIKSELGAMGNASGKITRYEYNTYGRLQKVYREMEGGADYLLRQYTYDGNDKVLSVANQKGFQYAYKYDAHGRQVQKIDSAGHVWKYFYDLMGHQTVEIDPLGIKKRSDYDDLGRLIGTIDGNNSSHPISLRRAENWQYDHHDSVVHYNDALGRVTRYQYNGLGDLTRTIGFRADTTWQSYTQGLLHGLRTPEGSWTYYHYDKADRMVKKVIKEGDTSSTPDASDYTEEYAYNDDGDWVRQTIAGQVVRKLGYSLRGEVIADTNGAGDRVQYTYHPLGKLKTKTLPSGQVVHLEYDNLNRLTRVYDALGDRRILTYSPSGLVVLDRTPGMGADFKTYTATGELLRSVDSTGVSTDYAYDNRHLLVSETDAQGQVITYFRDANGQVIRRRDPRGNSVYSAYDDLDRTILVRDAENNETSYSYQDFAGGSRIVTTYPDNIPESQTMDRENREVGRKTRKGDSTIYRYDFMGHLLEKEFQDHSKANYSYFPNGLLKEGALDGNKSEYEYDAAFRTTLHRQTILGETFDLGYRYNPDSNVVEMTYPDGYKGYEVYDKRDRLSSLATTTAGFAYTYQNNLLTGLSRTNGVTTSFSHDPSGRVSRIRHYKGAQTLQDFEYGFDNRGLATSSNAHHDLDKSQAYAYTPDEQLVDFKVGVLDGLNEVPSPTSHLAWNFDSRGNWSSLNRDGALDIRGHNNLNEVTQAGGSTITYDLNGQMTGLSGLAMQWNNRDQLEDANGNVYVYDCFGRRIAKQLVGGAVEKFVLDGERVVYKKSSAGVNQRYVYGGRYIDDFLYASKSDGSDYFPLTDRMFSVTGIANGAGALVEKVEYEPYGEFSLFSAAGAPLTASSVGNDVYFTGRSYDTESGLYYFRNRYMEPGLGRFVSMDPIRFKKDVHGLDKHSNKLQKIETQKLYSYTDNSPENYVDPYGLDPDGPFLPDATRKPPGWTPDWETGNDGRPYSEDPVTGKRYYPHPEDDGHHDHYDTRDKGKNKDGPAYPEKSDKPRSGQKRPPYGDQSAKDPWPKPDPPGKNDRPPNEENPIKPIPIPIFPFPILLFPPACILDPSKCMTPPPCGPT